MKLRLIGLAFAVWLLPSAANAQVMIEMSRITCQQYLAMGPSQQRDFSAWMSGWFNYQLNKTTIDLIAASKNIDNVKAWCVYHPRETVMAGLQRATGTQ